jgi:hypothetical protein
MAIKNAGELIFLRILVLLIANLAAYFVLEPVAILLPPDAGAAVKGASRKNALALCVRFPATGAHGALVAAGNGVQERKGC